MNRPPEAYDEWRRCIEQDCGIALTAGYIAQRVQALHDRKDYQTLRFVELFGQAHLDRVIDWFARAGKEIADGGLRPGGL